jgi:hypothetical protein
VDVHDRIADVDIHRSWRGRAPAGNVGPLMSKRTKKATLRARKKKANHGRKPNRGRNS